MERDRRRKWYAAVLCILVFVAFGLFYDKRQQPGTNPGAGPITATSFKLNTVVKLTIYDSQDSSLLDEAMELCDAYEWIFSRTREDSELYRLNHGLLEQEKQANQEGQANQEEQANQEGQTEWGSSETSQIQADTPYIISDACAELISLGLSYGEVSGGAFDITIEPFTSLWDFTSGEKKIPDEKELEAAGKLVDYRDVSLDGNTVSFAKDGMSLELGAIAKGYIADKMKEFLISKGVKSAIIDLGGNVLCIGKRPDGQPFRIGIRRPFADRNETVATVEITDQSVVSSGVYERYFEKDGELYHHILNPKTGYPYDNGLVSVTIISDKSVDGDGLSTSCFALGLEQGMELVNSLTDVHAVFVTEDGELHFSEGFEKELKLTY